MAPIAAKSSAHERFNNVFSMLTCPTYVRVGMVLLTYDDGAQFTYASPDLRISATPSERMEISDTEAARHWLPVTVSGTMQIDADGHVRILTLDSAPDDLSAWLKNEFARWKFTPAVALGKPITVQFPFMFFLGDTTHDWVQVELIRRRGAHGPMLVWPKFD